MEPAERVTTVVRLGQGVDETGGLHEDAVARTHACIAGYAPRIEAYGPARRLLIATSVLRDARDGRQFLVALKYDFGLPWRILSGREEGTLAFRGGTSWLRPGAGPPEAPPAPAAAGRGSGAAAPDPLLLVDIGGGSTEFAVGSAGEPPTFVRSLDVGVVRLTERFLHHDPPEAAEVAALTGHVAAAIADAVPAELRAAVRGAVGVAGTYTTLVANKLGMTEYDGRLVQGHVLSLADDRRGRRPLRRAHQRRARPAPGHPARPRGRDPRRGPDRARGVPCVRPRRRPRQRGRPPRGRRPRARGRVACRTLTGKPTACHPAARPRRTGRSRPESPDFLGLTGPARPDTVPPTHVVCPGGPTCCCAACRAALRRRRSRILPACRPLASLVAPASCRSRPR